MKYTYSDEEDEGYSDATTSRRSARNTGTHTPAEGPTVTLSGRQVKSRQGGVYGESMLSGTHTPAVTVGGFDGTSEEPEEGAGGRPRRAAAVNASSKGWRSMGGAHIAGYNSVDEMNDSDEDDASEQDYGDDEEEDDAVILESDNDEVDPSDEDDDINDGEDEKQTLVVKLPVKTPTPERKTVIKHRVSPEKDSVKSMDFQQTISTDQNNGSSTTASQDGTISTATATAGGVQSIANIIPSTSASESHMAAASSEATTAANPTAIPQKSPSNPIQSTPLSALAIRSPEKTPHTFPTPSINVGYGGS